MGERKPRITTQTLRVLGAFTLAPTEGLSGAAIAKRTNLRSGTLYPILFRLEQTKWLESEWEAGDPSEMGRPRCRFYKITALGEKEARHAYQELTEMIGGLACQNA
jgi:PadR family transcriptional regulator, regulatory protein PadR